MTTFGDMVYQLGGVPALAGIPFGPKAKYYFVDPNSAASSDGNAGTDLEHPLKTLAAAEDKCVANQHDTVFFIAGASADSLTAAITWDKSYTHLIGIGSQLPGVGQRCRVVMPATPGTTPAITFSGNGCIVKNIQFSQEKATGASGPVVVSGSRNYFENCFFMAPTAVTAASFSLKVGGTENAFVRCTVGQHTLVRNAATYGLWLYKGGGYGRNKFIDCEFLSWATGGGTAHALVYVDVDINVEVYVAWFENCLFDNIGAATLAVGIDDNCATTDHQIILRGRNNCFAQCTAVADPLTYVLAPDMNGDHPTSGLLMITVTET